MNFTTIWPQVLAVMAGGALGALVRFAVSAGMASLKWGEFPWGTFLVNLVGCFLMGLLYVASLKEMPQLLKVGIAIGFLGALTTFSTFALDTLLMWKRGFVLTAGIYCVGSVVLGLVLVRLGQWAGEGWWGPVIE